LSPYRIKCLNLHKSQLVDGKPACAGLANNERMATCSQSVERWVKILIEPRDYFRLLLRLALPILALLLALIPVHLGRAQGDFSLRFYGTGRDGVDRVMIPLDAPPRPVDVGGDFTIEFWLKALPGDNAASACSPGEDNWIYGNVVIDRDVYFAGDYGDYGISLADGRIVFGVNNGSEGTTLCGQTNVTDGRWHHIALTRSAADGSLAIFIDGRLDVRGDGPTGDVSYRDGRATQYPADPFLVIGAEKHDAGPEYPSFRGWIDEVRISRIIRYRGAFTPPTAPFTPDPDTVALYHFNEGAGVTVRDSSGAPGGPSDGALRVGGSPAGPAWSEDTPWISSSASPPHRHLCHHRVRQRCHRNHRSPRSLLSSRTSRCPQPHPFHRGNRRAQRLPQRPHPFPPQHYRPLERLHPRRRLALLRLRLPIRSTGYSLLQ
jgi:hypothetical protein